MSHWNGSLVVELVGPAGVGKTTLAQKIRRVDARVHVGLSVWGLPRARLIRGALGLVPTIVMAVLRRRRLRWVEITHMIRLEALRRVPGHLVHTFAYFPISRLTLPFLYYKTRPQETKAYGLLFIQ